MKFMSCDKIDWSRDKIVILLGVSTWVLAAKYDLSNMTSKPYSLSYFEHSSNWYFSIQSLWRYILKEIVSKWLDRVTLPNMDRTNIFIQSFHIENRKFQSKYNPTSEVSIFQWHLQERVFATDKNIPVYWSIRQARCSYGNKPGLKC